MQVNRTKKRGRPSGTPSFLLPCYLLFGLAFVAPPVFLAVFGAAFLALAFVAILVRYV
jgi:hypothetical protein